MDINYLQPSTPGRLDTWTRKWWIYLLILLLWFIPPYVANGYGDSGSFDLIAEVLSDPLIYAAPILLPISKVLTLVLIAGLFIFGNRIRRLFNGYVALTYLLVGTLQTSTISDTFGFMLLVGNALVILVVTIAWVWEFFVQRNDFSPRSIPLWKWWVAPLAIFAYMTPVNYASLSPDFNLARMATNDACLAYCMFTPVILAVLTLFHPSVNVPLLRLSAFVGILHGVVNMITWFIIMPQGWWMGVLHIPLMLISVYAFWLGFVKNNTLGLNTASG